MPLRGRWLLYISLTGCWLKSEVTSISAHMRPRAEPGKLMSRPLLMSEELRPANKRCVVASAIVPPKGRIAAFQNPEDSLAATAQLVQLVFELVFSASTARDDQSRHYNQDIAHSNYYEHNRAQRWTALLFSSSKPKPSELQLRKGALLRRTPRPCHAQAPLPLPISLASRISATAPFFKNPLAGPLV